MAETLGQNASSVHQADIYYPGSTAEKEIIYPEQREDDMGETSIHAKLINRLVQMLLHFLEGRKDVFLSTNINLYYDEEFPTKWYAPDILIAFGVTNHERSSYQVWKENVPPQVIFEVSSERTWKTDISEKLEIYAGLGVEEYYILDPGFEYLPAPMLAFHGQAGRLLTAAVNDGRIFSSRLGLEIVRTDNDFRLFDPKKNEFLRTLEESESELTKLRLEIERLKADK